MPQQNSWVLPHTHTHTHTARDTQAHKLKKGIHSIWLVKGLKKLLTLSRSLIHRIYQSLSLSLSPFLWIALSLSLCHFNG